MTNPTEGSMEGLHELLAERGRYEGWLHQLEERRATTPLHVLERVRADYTARLDHVTTQLRGRAVDLEASVASLRSRLSALASEEEARRDERAETELRASVGEFPPDQARTTIEQCDAAIASLAAQRDALGGELAKLQQVLVLVVQAPAPMPEPVAAPAPDVEPSRDTASVLESITALAPDVVPEAPMEVPAVAQPTNASAVAELEFLRSVVSTQDAGVAAAEAGSELVPPPVLTAPRRGATPMSSGTLSGLRDPLRAVQGDGSITPTNMPSFLKDMPTEQVKTLKCQECGTMNFPTEWYCERCGGELAAM
ncbi:MAG: hypothetical protein IT361_15905 [Gemmatimonadaceae bacterium]|nr:hypothetical protein [Gemmatimonadaceae bacterium]